jgi:hypothetical protein
MTCSSVKGSGLRVLRVIKMKAGWLRDLGAAWSYKGEDCIQETRSRITKCEKK